MINNLRRALYQAFRHSEKVRDWAFDARTEAKKKKHLDLVQSYTEIIHENSQERAHIRRLSRAMFQCEPEDLAVYK